MTSPRDPVRLSLFTTHPIQYQVPWFRALHQTGDVELTVHYASIPDARAQGDGFGVTFQWDIPMLDGYAWRAYSPRRGGPGGVPHGHTFRSLRQATSASAADVVLVTGWQHPYLRHAALLAKLQRRPSIVRGESNALRTRRPEVRLLHRAFLSLFDQFLVIGKANEEFYRRNGCDDRRFSSCPYFVDNERFLADSERLAPAVSQARAAWGIPQDAVCFLFSGKFIEKKRPLDVLEAVARLARETCGVHLLMVGDGNLAEEARRYARETSLPVTFTGFLNQREIGRAYAAADALVLPSDYGETWGLVVNEAMVFGLPAIVSDRVGCGPDLVQSGVTGYRFPFGDVEALATAMARLCRDPEHRQRMGAAAKGLVLTRYSVEAAVEGTLEAVRAAVGQEVAWPKGKVA